MIKHNKQETTEKTIGSIEGTSAIVLCEIDKKDRIETRGMLRFTTDRNKILKQEIMSINNSEICIQLGVNISFIILKLILFLVLI